jgi:hypothetical protein
VEWLNVIERRKSRKRRQTRIKNNHGPHQVIIWQWHTIKSLENKEKRETTQSIYNIPYTYIPTQIAKVKTIWWLDSAVAATIRGNDQFLGSAFYLWFFNDGGDAQLPYIQQPPRCWQTLCQKVLPPTPPTFDIKYRTYYITFTLCAARYQ